MPEMPDPTPQPADEKLRLGRRLIAPACVTLVAAAAVSLLLTNALLRPLGQSALELQRTTQLELMDDASLIELACHEESAPGDRREALAQLVSHGASGAAGRLASCLAAHPDDPIRENLIGAIGRSREPARAAAVVPYLLDEKRRVRDAAALAVALLLGPEQGPEVTAAILHLSPRLGGAVVADHGTREETESGEGAGCPFCARGDAPGPGGSGNPFAPEARRRTRDALRRGGPALERWKSLTAPAARPVLARILTELVGVSPFRGLPGAVPAQTTTTGSRDSLRRQAGP